MIRMMGNGMRSTLFAAAVLGVSAAALAQTAPDSGSSMAADKTFVMMADEGNSAEISASQIALKKSKNPDVKAYATQMISDHQKLRSDMAPYAQKLGVMTPQPLNATHKAEDQRLSQLSGKKFDAEYLKAMSEDHNKTLGMFRNEEATTADPSLKSAVMQGDPVVAQHLQMANDMASKMGVMLPTEPPVPPMPTSGAL